MSKVKSKIRKLHIVSKSIFEKWKQDKSGKDGILILFPGKIGSAILFCGFIEQLEAYSKEKKIPVSVLTTKSVARFVSTYFSHIAIYGIYDEDIETNFVRFNAIIDYFQEKSYRYIINVCNCCMINTALMCAIGGKYRIAVRDCSKDSHGISGRVKQTVYLKIYDKVINTYQETSCIDYFCHALNVMEEGYFKKKLYSFPYSMADEDDYCVISPGASLGFKCWPTKSYVSVIRYIIQNFDYKVYLIGDKKDAKVSAQIMKEFQGSVRVVEYTGRTSFQEWISLIGNARFLLGNDSSAIHIAASVGTGFICIKGQWLGGKFLPYPGLDVGEVKKSHVVESEKMPCRLCGSPLNQKGININDICYCNVKKGESCVCIANVPVENIVFLLSNFQEYKANNEYQLEQEL